MKHVSTATYFYVAAIILVVALIGFAVTKKTTPSPYNDFAQCLSDNGVKMYGAWWCPHCQRQKELFGSSFEKINYTECSSPGSQAMNQICKEAKVEGYPTWEFKDGTRASGEQTLEFLGTTAGCVLPSSSTP